SMEGLTEALFARAQLNKRRRTAASLEAAATDLERARPLLPRVIKGDFVSASHGGGLILYREKGSTSGVGLTGVNGASVDRIISLPGHNVSAFIAKGQEFLVDMDGTLAWLDTSAAQPVPRLLGPMPGQILLA